MCQLSVIKTHPAVNDVSASNSLNEGIPYGRLQVPSASCSKGCHGKTWFDCKEGVSVRDGEHMGCKGNSQGAVIGIFLLCLPSDTEPIIKGKVSRAGASTSSRATLTREHK